MEKEPPKRKQAIITSILKHPLTAIVAIGVGAFIGFTNGEVSKQLDIYGEIYLILLKMTVLPILTAAIITSIGRFISSPSMNRLFGRIMLTLFLACFLFAALGVGVGLIFKPGNLSEESREIISEQVSLQSEVLEVELSSTDEGTNRKLSTLLAYLPENIIRSLYSNEVVAVLVFSMLFGLATGALANKKKKKTQIVLEFFDEIYEIFSNIISYLIMFLPLALICIISSEIANSGIQIIVSTGKLIMLFYIFGFLIILGNTAYLSLNLKYGYIKSIKGLLYPTLIAFTTRNSIASMSVAITTLQRNFNTRPGFSKSTMPLLTILGRFGNIFYFGLVAIFSAQIYYISINISLLIFLTISIVFAGIATAGASGFVTLGLLAIVMEPIGVPFDTILVILLIIDVLIDPLRTALIIHTNTVLTAVLHKYYNPRAAMGKKKDNDK